MKALKPLVMFLVLVAGLAYLGAIAWAGIASLKLPGPPKLPEIVTYVIATIGGVLATNFGALFGISVLPTSGQRGRSLTIGPRGPAPGPRPSADMMQVVAAYVYILSLVLAVAFWIFDGLSSDTADVLRNMTFTLFGVGGGVLAVILNVK